MEICKRCVMDTTDKDIKFDDEGICNHCRGFEKSRGIVIRPYNEWIGIVEKIKEMNKKKSYDCVIGISGGVDSSYMAYQAHKHGLRAILVHFDNGWDSKKAKDNIQKIIKYTNYDYKLITCDQEEFYDIQRAYMKAGVLNWEVISDMAIAAATYDIAIKDKIKFLLSGSNLNSEGIMPRSWVYSAQDSRNIQDIYKKFGSYEKIETLPIISYYRRLYHEKIAKDVKRIKMLNYLDYNRKLAIKEMAKLFNWEDCGEKHYESVWTRFYQAYVLPTRYGVDMRKAHYSALINSGQMTKKEALSLLKKPAYEPKQLKKDKKEVLSRLNISEEEFEEIMTQPIREHTDFKNVALMVKLFQSLFRRGRY